jgi:transmembrane sensor
MNAMSSSFDPAAHEQAALWAARLDGSKLSPADEAELAAWLAASPEHPSALSAYRDFSSELDEALPALVQAHVVALPVTPRPKPRSWLPWFAAGTALAGAAAVAVVVGVRTPHRQTEQLATALAQRQSITLVDGTRIDLNAHTRLQVEIGRVERHVRLSGGEAFFAVSKDKSRPFTVETPAGSVRVTGTEFDVRTGSAAGLEVTVVEGSVQVRPHQAGSPVQLGAGQRLITRDAAVDVETVSDRELSAALAWRQGQIVFDGIPLQEALDQLGRYHGRNISATPAASALRLGGRFSLDDLNAFFSGIEESLHVRVVKRSDGSVQVGLLTEQ